MVVMMTQKSSEERLALSFGWWWREREEKSDERTNERTSKERLSLLSLLRLSERVLVRRRPLELLCRLVLLCEPERRRERERSEGEREDELFEREKRARKSEIEP